MKITFLYDPIHEYQKMLFNMYKVSINWYQQKGFIATYYKSVDNNLNDDYAHNSKIKSKKQNYSINTNKKTDNKINLVFPKWDYIKTSDFWDKLNSIPRLYDNYPFINPDNIHELYDLCLQDKPIDVTRYSKNWKSLEKEFIKYYENNIDLDNKVKSVEVYLTRYGTPSTYIIGVCQNKSLLRIYLRDDQYIDEIAKSIVSGYFSISVDQVEDNPNTTYTWEEKNKIIDYHFINHPYKDLFPNYISTVDVLRIGEVKPKIIEDSNKIYAEIGFPLNCEMKIQNNQIKSGQEYIVNLTKSEKNVLIKLIQNKGEIISYDQIAETLWGQDYCNYFSIKAVNKIVERIKIKLKDHGIRKEIILNKRGLGYVYLG